MVDDEAAADELGKLRALKRFSKIRQAASSLLCPMFCKISSSGSSAGVSESYILMSNSLSC